MTYIYAFCNMNYGAPCIRMINDLTNKDSNIKCILIISGAGYGYGFKYLAKKIKRLFIAKKYATNLKVKIIRNINSPEFFNSIETNSIGVVCGFNQIFKDICISKFEHIVNCHPSILPFYRGAIPSYWCIKYGEHTTGFTIHKITPRIDDGDILFQGYVQIFDNDNETTLDRRICEASLPALHSYIRSLIDGNQFRRKILKSPYVTAMRYVPKDRG